MTFLQAIILGFIQGITEFLPISSSAHLVITPMVFQWKIPPEQAFIFNVLVQLGSLVAVLVYFWRDLTGMAKDFLQSLFHSKTPLTPQAHLGWLIIVATIPAGIIGLFLRDLVKVSFGTPVMAGAFLLVTAALLVMGESLGKRTRSTEQITWTDALWMGFFQALAIFPGVSRSGSTIAGGLFKGIDRPSATQFSFLMSIPVLLAAGVLEFGELLRIDNFTSQVPNLLAGYITAALTSYFSIRWLLKYISHRSFILFAVYCATAGMLTILLTLK